ncbi:hypothetical protein [Nocardioides ganghwensis]|uniref:Uncharacterized protein n=1 Tax=Nocardioides ganghwensis TaxID=252230 RepID=A0A4Q2S857_9ACTN|nr:hypothetical protein [Nocardioides ganghwensis]MBD3947553.1 hypothetical protein [Nocardioides ganghwensis]RYB99427.1 hypothetical protein EUA07_16515 [Nocardioides ganghwensis]
MAALISGGGSGAVAASSHAQCERFRRTDPLLTNVTRRGLARSLGFPDTGGRIPEARWVRAMAFESAVDSDTFVSELITRAIGRLGLDRPEGVRKRSCADSATETVTQLAQAHLKAAYADEATMLTKLAIPFLSLEDADSATSIKPDFAIVAPRKEGDVTVGSWLIMGDAKDYERVRARIDDGRMLKGFLQVALGAESAAAWSQLPDGMEVHRYGALAVPRNVYLRPEAVVEDLADHRREVRTRAEERLAALAEVDDDPIETDELPAYVAHLEATYDPTSCASCNLFTYCRDELRRQDTTEALLLELGMDRGLHPALLHLAATGEPGLLPTTEVARLTATTTGKPQWAGRRRTDAAGEPGTINVVLVKSDSAALGVHGIAVQRVTAHDEQPWRHEVFERTNATATRHDVMHLLGAEIAAVMESGEGPVHLVVPDGPTADVLVTMADSLAGVELSRLRWQRDLDEGRPILTFDGEEATMPDPLSDTARLAVSFLLEEDRARAFHLRQPIVVLRTVLAEHLVPGGPAVDAGRLDYLVTWAEAPEDGLDHRAVSDSIAESERTAGARMARDTSDEVHRAGRPTRGDAVRYHDLVTSELEYRIDILLRAIAVLGGRPDSRLRPAYRALEGAAQDVWCRRLALQASDLVRFSRTYRYWRNAQVDMIDADRSCDEQLRTLLDSDWAADRAADAGVRHLTLASVVSTSPVRLAVESRRFIDGTKTVLLHRAGEAVIEGAAVSLTIQKGSFKFGGASVGRLEDDGDAAGLLWSPGVPAPLAVGDRVVLAEAEWLGATYRSGHEFAVKRPVVDGLAAPKSDCTADSYAQDPQAHAWCCRPHAAAEAEWSDDIAERRAKGQLNPEVWPPIIDEERFDIQREDDPDVEVDDFVVPPDWISSDDLGEDQ